MFIKNYYRTNLFGKTPIILLWETEFNMWFVNVNFELEKNIDDNSVRIFIIYLWKY